MARTTPERVAGIIDVEEDDNLDPFIAVATALVSEVASETVYPDDLERPTLIEDWLAAHFYAMQRPRAEREQATGLGQSFQSKVDLGFNLSHYGQMAMRLDTNGGLAKLDAETMDGKKYPKVRVSWLGTTPSPYDSIP